jgi:Flp pilus assembly protein TadB
MKRRGSKNRDKKTRGTNSSSSRSSRAAAAAAAAAVAAPARRRRKSSRSCMYQQAPTATRKQKEEAAVAAASRRKTNTSNSMEGNRDRAVYLKCIHRLACTLIGYFAKSVALGKLILFLFLPFQALLMPLVLKMLGNGRVCSLRARGLKRHIQPDVQGPRAAMARAAANSSLACL